MLYKMAGRRGGSMTTAEKEWERIARFNLCEKTKLLAMLAEDVSLSVSVQNSLLDKERAKIRLARKLNSGKNKAIENALDDENI